LRRTFLIDTDTATDDAVALMLALRDPEIEVAAITVVAGNVPLAQAVQNALYVVERCGASVPVHAGAAAPLARPLRTAESAHGRDGMGDLDLALAGRTPAPGDASAVIVREVRSRTPGSVTLVTLGPLTNVALAFRADPSIASRLASVVAMLGTSDAVGNTTAVGEFNAWVDPEAAAEVLAAGAPITMVGWDISRRFATFDDADAAALRAVGPLGAFAVDLQRVLAEYNRSEPHLSGFDLPDPIAMAIAIDRSIATGVLRRNVRVETRGDLTEGQTVVDHLEIERLAPNADVVVEASRDGFIRLLHDRLRD